MTEDGIENLRAARDRTEATGSARFVMSVTEGRRPAGDEDIAAQGETSFELRTTRATQRLVSQAVLRQAEREQQHRHLLARWVLRIGTQAARRAGDPVECFYARGRLWTRANPDDAWSLNGRQDDDQASGREARDPAAILEVIDAVTGVNARDRTEEARPGRESELEATADLTLIADKLPSALRRALGDKPNRNWVTRVPVRAEIDDAGRLVRLSYAPMPPRPGSEEAELWTTVAFSDFGVEVPEPADLS